jgi:hypothetical protein
MSDDPSPPPNRRARACVTPPTRQQESAPALLANAAAMTGARGSQAGAGRGDQQEPLSLLQPALVDFADGHGASPPVGSAAAHVDPPLSPRHPQYHRLTRLNEPLTIRFRCVQGHPGIVTTRGCGAGVHNTSLFAQGHIAKPFTHTPDWRSILRAGMEFEMLVDPDPGRAPSFLRDDGERVLHYVRERLDTTANSMGNRWILSKRQVCVRAFVRAACCRANVREGAH